MELQSESRKELRAPDAPAIADEPDEAAGRS